jgi:hypothetical protein
MWTVDSGSSSLHFRVISSTFGEPWFILSMSDIKDGGDAAVSSKLTSPLLFSLAVQLASYLNTEVDRPHWLDELNRLDEVLAVSSTGFELCARGPLSLKHRFYDLQDTGPEAADKRARLMDRILLVKSMR